MNNHTNQTHCKRNHEFSPENTYRHSDGRRECRTCKKELDKAYAENNVESCNASKRRYSANNPEKCHAALMVQKFNSAGFTPETRKAKLEEQDNKCAICHREFAESANTCMDHEHIEPPKPRGMLCRKHNAALGGFEDSIELLESAISYLRKYGK